MPSTAKVAEGAPSPAVLAGKELGNEEAFSHTEPEIVAAWAAPVTAIKAARQGIANRMRVFKFMNSSYLSSEILRMDRGA